jgi:hypothetical protein
MLANVLFVAAQDVRRSCSVGLDVLIEVDAPPIAEVPGLADAQYHALHKAVEPLEQVW